MNFDGLTLNSILTELKPDLLDSLVNRIRMADRYTLILDLHSRKASGFSLVIRIDPQCFMLFKTKKLQLSGQSYQGNFLLILKKHLLHSKIENILQKDSDRILTFVFSQTTPFSGIIENQLHVEFTGKYSNLILTQNEDKQIIGCLTSILPDLETGRRALYPGINYTFDSNQNRHSLLEDIPQKEVFSECPELTEKFLLETFQGMSRYIAREIIFQLEKKSKPLFQILTEFQKIISEDSEKYFYSKFNWISNIFLEHITEQPEIYKSFEIFSDQVEKNTLEKQLFEKAAKPFRKKLKAHIKKIEKTMQKTILSQVDDGTADMEKGKLIITWIYLLKKGLTEFSPPDCPEKKIPLDPLLSPQENSQKYFKNSKKKSRTQKINEARGKLFQESLDFLQRLWMSTELFHDFSNLCELELEYNEFCGISVKFKKKHRLPPMEIITYKLRDNVLFYVGKNDKQNEYLTNQLAGKNDIFFHTKDIPGAHGILKFLSGEKIEEKDILICGEIIAYFSRARTDLKVPVQYTPKKHLKKPKGGKTGLVILLKEEIIIVSPSENLTFREEDSPFKRINSSGK